MTTPARYHPGEITAQGRAGLREQAEHSRLAIKDAIPPAAVDFLAAQPMLVLAAMDHDGRSWTTLLSGPAGFATVVDERTVMVRNRPSPDDPLAPVLLHPAPVGTIALEPGTRRRMRLNGTSTPAGSGLSISVEQVYANCPKYISHREPEAVAEPTSPPPARISRSLSAEQQHLITEADTFFVGSHSRDGDVDASHRGGRPGFVVVHDRATLTWPDYVGNAMMMTLGNLIEQPSAGLLFVDWSTGTTLQLTGTAGIDWSPDPAPPGANRLVHYAVDHVVQLDRASPLRWTEASLSRFDPPLPETDEDP